MAAEKSQAEVLAWIADVFESPAEKIRPDTKRPEIEAWDSLGILTLIARMDEDFQFLLTEDEIQGLNSVGDILDLLRRHGLLKDAP